MTHAEGHLHGAFNVPVSGSSFATRAGFILDQEERIVIHANDEAEAQKRTDAKSQRYEGLLQVFDAKGKVSDKRWTLDRLGSHGDSKVVLRFTLPAELATIAPAPRR